MKALLKLAWLCFLLISSSCSAKLAESKTKWVGSTPGDNFIKSILTFPADMKIDFIRWSLNLDSENLFTLKVVYGESQPNTLGFIGNGETKNFKGTYTVSQADNFKKVYHLKSTGFSSEMRLAKLTENVFHLLTSENQLEVGNGGWSYVLNRENMEDTNGFLFTSKVIEENTAEVIFDGRTPCREIAAEHPEIQANESCFKLKWRLILLRDPETGLPDSYTLRKVINGKRLDVSGKWVLRKGLPDNPEAVIYTLESENPEETFSFLAVDNSVLLFLNKSNEALVGNKDFSFTLNRVNR